METIARRNVVYTRARRTGAVLQISDKPTEGRTQISDTERSEQSEGADVIIHFRPDPEGLGNKYLWPPSWYGRASIKLDVISQHVAQPNLKPVMEPVGRDARCFYGRRFEVSPSSPPRVVRAGNVETAVSLPASALCR